MKTILFSLFVACLVSCSKDPAPVPPTPPNPQSGGYFKVTGKTVVIEAEVKKESKVSLEEAKRSMQSAVRVMEKQ